MKHAIFLLIAVLFSSSVLASHPNGAVPQGQTEFYSFENDMEGWTANGTNLEIGNGFVPWSILRSQDRATDGNTSLKVDLHNLNDAAKIWIEKPFPVEPNQLYQVNVEYDFASTGGELGAFRIITGALKRHPQTSVDLIPANKDSTDNGGRVAEGYKWANRNYEFTVQTEDEAMIYVVIGIWGTFEIRQIFYLDQVRVTFSKKPQGSKFFSFENDLEGWASKSTDLESTNGGTDWSITRSQDIWEDGGTSVKFDLNNLNGHGKIWMERPFSVEPGKKYKVSVDYAFNSNDCGDAPRFRIITGVLRKQPQSADDLVDAFQGNTKSGSCAWGWAHKSYQFTLKSKRSEMLYFVIGIWGTEAAHRTYNFDSVCVTLTKK